MFKTSAAKLARNREYYARNKEALADKKRAYYAENKDRIRSQQALTKYGVTSQQVAEMLSAQSYKCAICRTDSPGGSGDWHIDHCHGTGRVRGLLCSRCNTGLGQFRDNTEFLSNAIVYLNDTRRPDSPVSGTDQ